MDSSAQPFVVGVRFSKVGKIYHFDASQLPDLKLGDFVVVETSRGWQLGEVAQLVSQPTPPADGIWKQVERLATPRDLLLRQTWQQREVEVMVSCRARAAELRLAGVKIVAAEYSFDGTRLSILFSTESEEKVDLKSLRQDMQRLYNHSQVELRQIGPRDVAKIIGGMGACGLEARCCSRFLTDFSSISIRMAKEQGISLTPSEITGMCGRLRCCLIYEYEQYVAARQGLPKKNKRVLTPQGEGKVVDVFPLREAVLVDLPEVGYREFAKQDIQPAEELENLQKKAQNPCNNSGDENCACGKNGASKNE
jgi:cell fate regulator YaaT (PSP1 superfamily)